MQKPIRSFAMLNIVAVSENCPIETLKWRHEICNLYGGAVYQRQSGEVHPLPLSWHYGFTFAELRLNQTVGPSQFAFKLVIAIMAAAAACSFVHAEANPK